MNFVYWVIVVVGYLIAFATIIYAFIIALSLFNEVPYVPVDKKALKIAFELLGLKRGDNFVDVGSGDGRVVMSASKYLNGSGTFTGIEFSKSLVAYSNGAKLITKHRSRIRFILGDMFKQKYSKYNRVYLYLTSSFANKIISKLVKELRPGARIVSVYFPVDISSDERIDVEEKKYDINGKIRSFYLITIK